MANSVLGREMWYCLVKGLGMSEGPLGQVNTTQALWTLIANNFFCVSGT